MTRISDATIRTEESVKVIKDEQLPSVTKAASEARDGVLRLGIRVENLERTPHVCIEGERQARQDGDIADMKPRFHQLTANLKWAIGIGISIAVVVGGALIGFYGATYSTAESTKARVESNREKITEHNSIIRQLSQQQMEDRKLYLKEVKNIPENLSRKESAIIEDLSDSKELTYREKQLLQRILKKAKSTQND